MDFVSISFFLFVFLKRRAEHRRHKKTHFRVEKIYFWRVRNDSRSSQVTNQKKKGFNTRVKCCVSLAADSFQCDLSKKMINKRASGIAKLNSYQFYLLLERYWASQGALHRKAETKQCHRENRQFPQWARFQNSKLKVYLLNIFDSFQSLSKGCTNIQDSAL